MPAGIGMSIDIATGFAIGIGMLIFMDAADCIDAFMPSFDADIDAGLLEHCGTAGAASLVASTIWLMTGANTMSHMASRPSQAVIEVRLPRLQ
jgi:hypothetical protein